MTNLTDELAAIDRAWNDGAKAGYRVGYDHASNPTDANRDCLTRLLQSRSDDISAYRSSIAEPSVPEHDAEGARAGKKLGRPPGC